MAMPPKALSLIGQSRARDKAAHGAAAVPHAEIDALQLRVECAVVQTYWFSANPVSLRPLRNPVTRCETTSTDSWLRKPTTGGLPPLAPGFWEIEERFRSEFKSAVESYKPPSSGSQFVQLPQIPRLDEECHNFLYEMKNTFAICSMCSTVYTAPTSRRRASSSGPSRAPSRSSNLPRRPSVEIIRRRNSWTRRSRKSSAW